MDWLKNIFISKKLSESKNCKCDGEKTLLNEKLVKLNNELLISNNMLMEANKELEKLDQAKSDFLSLISHELRTPINGISGVADILEAVAENEEQAELVGLLKDSAKKLLKFADTALFITNLKAAKKNTIKKERLLVSQIVYRAINEQGLKKAGNRAIIDKTMLSELEITADLESASKAVFDIVKNALFHTMENTTVTIDAYRDKSYAVIEVRDNGHGFPSKMIETFPPLFSAEDIEHHSEGLGLGLYVVNLIMELNGGKMTISNLPDNGGASVKLFFISD